MKSIKTLSLLFCFVTLFFSSCSKDYEVIPPEGYLVLSADNSLRLINNPISFTVITQNGEDVTADAVFYVDDQIISDNTYTSATPGTFSVKAVYSGVTTDIVSVTFHDGSQINFKKRVLIEDYTGTWCGFCTRVAYAIEQVQNATDNAVAVAIHRSSSNPSDSNYDPYNFDSSTIENLLPSTGYPKGYLNRMTQWQFPEPSNINQVVNLTQGANPKLGLAMTTSVSGTTANVDVRIKFSNNFTNLKLVVYVLENGLVYSQYNYTSYYGAVNPIPNYVHNHVLRHCATNLLGDAIADTETTSGNIYNKSFTINLPTTIENVANIEFVAFVVDDNGNTINVRKASHTATQTFEEI